VEDEESLRKLTRVFLEIRGYLVLEASNGHEALQVAERYPGSIHVLLTDAVMPGMSGRELAERLVRLRPEMKVVSMSAYTEDAIVGLGILDEETAFLEKPFSPDDLASKIRDVLKSEKHSRL
jgi:CheY-like chemotaxis protein